VLSARRGVALGTLNKILMALALVVLFFIALSVFRIDVTKSLTSLYTLGIAFSFVFKNAAGNAFDSIMFLFVTQ
jgi:small-conductance mechanosensitive channel